MSYKVQTIENFEKEVKQLIKKYPSLLQEIDELIDSLMSNPFQGEALGNGVYKIRIAIASKRKGKRGGGGVMTQVKVVKETVYLFSIYSKGNKDDISAKEIEKLLKEIPS